jgi:hypothetical protein
VRARDAFCFCPEESVPQGTVGEVLRAEHAQRRGDAALEVVAREPVQRAVVARLLARREAVVDARRAGEEAEAAADLVGPRRRVHPRHLDPARGRAEDRGEHAQRGGLAGAVRAEEPEHLPRLRREGDAVHGADLAGAALAEHLHEALDDDHGDPGTGRRARTGSRNPAPEG